MYTPYLVPVSVKGILFEDGKVWLRFNERQEWELPGGKLDPGEQPEQTVTRELLEELGCDITPTMLVQAYLYTIAVSSDESRGVLVLTYVCELKKRVGDFELIGEAGLAKFQAFLPDEIASLPMPAFYKEAIEKALTR